MICNHENPAQSSEPRVDAIRPGWAAGDRRPQWPGYALAVTATAAAVLVHLGLGSRMGEGPAVIVLVIPIILSAYVGGLGPGLVSTVVATLGTHYLLLSAAYTLHMATPVDTARWLGLIAVGVLVSLLSEALHRSRRRSQASEERFRMLFENSPVPIVEEDLSAVKLRLNELQAAVGMDLRSFLTTHPDEVLQLASLAKIVDVNQATVRFLGAGSKEDVWRHLPQYFGDRALAVFADEMVTLAGGATRFDHEIPIKTMLGEEKDLQLGLNIGAGHEETWSRVFVSFIDLTARKRAEQALRASEERFQLAMRGADDGLWEWDLKSGAAYYSPRWKAMLGYAEEELENHPDTVMRLVHPQDLEPVLTVMRNCMEAHSDKFDVEFRMRHKDGHYLDIRARGFLLFAAAGETVRMVGTHVDMTERRRAEEALRAREAQHRAVIETAADGFWMVDDDGRFLEVNDVYVERSGYSRQELLSMRVADVEAYERPEETAAHFEKIRRAGSDLFETLHRTKDGTVWQAEVTVSYWPIAGGRFFGFIRDITERKQAEEALRRSEGQLRLVTDTVPAVIAYVGTDCRYRWVNEEYRHWFGESLESISGRHIREVLGDPAWHIVRPFLERALAGEPVKYELEIPYRAGGRRWVDVTYTPDRDESGRVRGIVSLAYDVSAAKRIEVTLRESEERLRHEHALLRALIDSIPDLIFFKDMHSVYLGCNKAFEVYSGIPESALIGKTDLEITSRDVAEVYRQADREMLASGKVWRGEEWIPFKDGGGGYFDTLKTPYYHPDGGVLGLIGVSRNITARKQAEQQLRLQSAALEAAANGIVIADRAGDIQWVNTAFTRLTGYSAAEAIGQNPRLLKSGRHDAAFYKNLWETIAAGRVWRSEVVNRRKDGILYTEDMTITPVRVAGGDTSHFIAIKQDITERKLAEEARVQLEAQLHLAQKMEALGTLAGGVAHDFNNILGAIVGNVELARQDVGPSHPAVASLDEIRKASRRAKELVQRILAFSRQQPKLQSVITLRPVVEDAIKFLRASFPVGVELAATFAANTPTVLADPTQIEQVLLNLCTNAWQALEGAAGRIDIRLDGITLDDEAAGVLAHLRPGRWARLAVADTGTGMDRATLERVFEPFFTTKPPGQGTGLGLAIVHGIVKAHGGAINLDSQPGRGTTFTLYLPAAAAPEESVTPEPAVIELRVSAGGQHVLYLDDDEALVILATRTLERLGYRVSGYTRAEAALAAVRADPGQIDLVVTDLNMPGTSGLEVARKLARLRPDLPVVLASGYITEELQAQALQAGVLELISKPNTLEELCAVVQRHAGEAKQPQKDKGGNGTHPSDR